MKKSLPLAKGVKKRGRSSAQSGNGPNHKKLAKLGEEGHQKGEVAKKPPKKEKSTAAAAADESGADLKKVTFAQSPPKPEPSSARLKFDHINWPDFLRANFRRQLTGFSHR